MDNPEKPNNKILHCDSCDCSGIIEEGESFYSCPACYMQHRLVEVIEVAIANLVLDKKADEAEELGVIYDLLHDCPLLAYLEAEHQGRSRKFLKRIKSTFHVRPLR